MMRALALSFNLLRISSQFPELFVHTSILYKCVYRSIINWKNEVSTTGLQKQNITLFYTNINK